MRVHVSGGSAVFEPLAVVPSWTYEWFQYILRHPNTFVEMLKDQLTMVFVGEFAAILVAIPLGIFATRSERIGWAVMNAGAVAQTIPPLAVIALSFTFLGLGRRPVILALFFYALLPILQNTAAGIRQVSEAQREAARGMGMTGRQRLFHVELPLALPIIFAGIRTSTVLGVGVAYLGAFVGAGGFGQWVILGQQVFETHILLAGAIPGALLVVVLDRGFEWFEAQVTPAGVARAGENIAAA